MNSSMCQNVFSHARTVVVKVGSNVLARDDDQLDQARVQDLSEQIGRLRKTGRNVIVVSSGAVAAGIGILGLNGRPQSLSQLQAAAAAGQPQLMTAWGKQLTALGHRVAQILVTVNDFRNRQRYLNVRNTVRTLLDLGVVPIVNENDTVSVEEITVGDNDQLAAMVATLVEDPLLVILSDVDGLLGSTPGEPASNLIPVVEQPSDDLQSLVANEVSSRGTGGMQAKLKAIVAASGMGECVILANGRTPQVLDQIADGQSTGTLFLASGGSVPAWKKWIGYTTQPAGILILDAGAEQAVRNHGRSLLAVGIQQVEGEFEQGASVAMASGDGNSFGRGLANYSAADIRIIAGARSNQIPDLLGHVPYGEVIHRDNLVLINGNT
ncbi:MAG: glutamate 5-kinase [Fuerstiella sp.]|nr:glutamate 5-kinase [Fuerstiella sp.]